MFSPNQHVMVDGSTPGVVEKSVGGDDYIVRMGGSRIAVAGFRMRAASQENVLSPGGMPPHPDKIADLTAPPAETKTGETPTT